MDDRNHDPFTPTRVDREVETVEAGPDAVTRARWTVTDWLIVGVATGGFVGMIPPRTATTGTIWGVPLALGLYQLVGWWGYLPALALLWWVGIPLCRRAAELLNHPDPRAVVYDEYATLPLLYFLVPGAMAGEPGPLAAGFGLHRLFDILKPFGIRRIERLGGGRGIMLDDVAAAALGWVTYQGLRWLVPLVTPASGG